MSKVEDNARKLADQNKALDTSRMSAIEAEKARAAYEQQKRANQERAKKR